MISEKNLPSTNPEVAISLHTPLLLEKAKGRWLCLAHKCQASAIAGALWPPAARQIRDTFTHCGIFRQKPLRDGNVVIGNFPGDVPPILCLPQQRVQIRKVVVDVDPVVGPASQGPAAQLRALREGSECEEPQTVG